jgi:hypothetical protein
MTLLSRPFEDLPTLMTQLDALAHSNRDIVFRGRMNEDPALLYEPPFTDIAPTGPERVFDEARVARLFSKIREINDSAVA